MCTNAGYEPCPEKNNIYHKLCRKEHLLYFSSVYDIFDKKGEQFNWMWHLVLWLIDLMVFGQRFLQSWWFFDSIHIITFSPLFYGLPLQTSSGVYILKKCILLISRDDFIHMLGNLLNLQFRYWRSQYISAIFSFLQEVYPIAVFVFTGIFFYIPIVKREYDLKEIQILPIWGENTQICWQIRQ